MTNTFDGCEHYFAATTRSTVNLVHLLVLNRRPFVVVLLLVTSQVNALPLASDKQINCLILLLAVLVVERIGANEAQGMKCNSRERQKRATSISSFVINYDSGQLVAALDSPSSINRFPLLVRLQLLPVLSID